MKNQRTQSVEYCTSSICNILISAEESKPEDTTEGVAPAFISTFKDQELAVGVKLNLKCTFEGTQTIYVKWLQ